MPVTSQIATRFRLWRQEVSCPVILQSMVQRITEQHNEEDFCNIIKFS
jgi:hypothetical protein